MSNYPLDTYGTTESNLVVDEPHTNTRINYRDYLYIVPNYAPFYRNNLEIIHETPNGSRILNYGIDYNVALEYPEATESIGIPIFGAIILNSLDLTGTIKITYQTLGGDWVGDPQYVRTQLANLAYNPRITTWSQVTNIQTVFPPDINHDHPFSDITGQQEVIDAINAIRDTLSQRNPVVILNPPGFQSETGGSYLTPVLVEGSETLLDRQKNLLALNQAKAACLISGQTLLIPPGEYHLDDVWNAEGLNHILMLGLLVADHAGNGMTISTTSPSASLTLRIKQGDDFQTDNSVGIKSTSLCSGTYFPLIDVSQFKRAIELATSITVNGITIDAIIQNGRTGLNRIGTAGFSIIPDASKSFHYPYVGKIISSHIETLLKLDASASGSKIENASIWTMVDGQLSVSQLQFKGAGCQKNIIRLTDFSTIPTVAFINGAYRNKVFTNQTLDLNAISEYPNFIGKEEDQYFNELLSLKQDDFLQLTASAIGPHIPLKRVKSNTGPSILHFKKDQTTPGTFTPGFGNTDEIYIDFPVTEGEIYMQTISAVASVPNIARIEVYGNGFTNLPNNPSSPYIYFHPNAGGSLIGTSMSVPNSPLFTWFRIGESVKWVRLVLLANVEYRYAKIWSQNSPGISFSDSYFETITRYLSDPLTTTPSYFKEEAVKIADGSLWKTQLVGNTLEFVKVYPQTGQGATSRTVTSGNIMVTPNDDIIYYNPSTTQGDIQIHLEDQVDFLDGQEIQIYFGGAITQNVVATVDILANNDSLNAARLVSGLSMIANNVELGPVLVGNKLTLRYDESKKTFFTTISPDRPLLARFTDNSQTSIAIPSWAASVQIDPPTAFGNLIIELPETGIPNGKIVTVSFGGALTNTVATIEFTTNSNGAAGVINSPASTHPPALSVNSTHTYRFMWNLFVGKWMRI